MWRIYIVIVVFSVVANTAIFSTMRVSKQEKQIKELKALVNDLKTSCINKAKPSPVNFEIQTYVNKD